MKNVLLTKRLCRAGIFAALYVVLTYAFAPFAFGPLQIRPAEALCILPLFFIEAVPALWIGCMISNLSSPFLLYDVLLGSLTTLVAGLCTYAVGRVFKKDGVRLTLGGIFPVLFNALMIPLIIVFLCGDLSGKDSAWTAYFFYATCLLLTQSVWVYGLGTPLYFLLRRQMKSMDHKNT
ncbi:MAG: QueT transporter family protein [Clostridia bacterium]|nr:QueT transporter family protein [Clostridia bacterium]